MARALTDAERQLISAMITSAKASNPDQFESQQAWQQWRHQLHDTIDRITVGASCHCGKCPSVELLVDDKPVPAGKTQIILEAFVSEGLVMLYVDDDQPSYLEIAPNLDVQLDLPDEKALIF